MPTTDKLPQTDCDRVEEGTTNQPRNTVLKDLFSSGGEMGARIQVFDWSTTSIGAIETWPQSLQIALQ
ncbi:MAG: hypothetical protein WCA35_05055, partial [Kovacikia sp.]